MKISETQWKNDFLINFKTDDLMETATDLIKGIPAGTSWQTNTMLLEIDDILESRGFIYDNCFGCYVKNTYDD